MPTFTVVDARGETASFSVAPDVLRALGGVLEALAADDAPNQIPLADVGFPALSATQFVRVALACYAPDAWDRLEGVHSILTDTDAPVLLEALRWVGAPEAVELARSHDGEAAATNPFRQRMRALQEGWDVALVAQFRPMDRWRVLGECVRRARAGSAVEVGRLALAAATLGCLDSLRFLWHLHSTGGLAARVRLDLAEEDNQLFRRAAQHGHLPILEWLWERRRIDGVAIDPAVRNNFAFRVAAAQGHLPILQFLWERHVTDGVAIDPTVDEQVAFCRAAEGGHVAVLEFLWRLHEEAHVAIDPTVRNNAPFRGAAEYGHVPVLEFLWRLKKEHGVGVDPTAEGSAAFVEATRRLHRPVLEFLWRLRTEDRVRLNPVGSDRLRTLDDAAAHGDVAIVGFLLRAQFKSDPRGDFTPPTSLSSAFVAASANGHVPVMETLWHFHETEGIALDVAFGGGAAVQRAARAGHAASLEFLARLKKAGHPVDFRGHQNEPLMEAAANGHVAVVEFLWRESVESGAPIDFTRCTRSVFAVAAEGAHLPVLEFLWNLRTKGGVFLHIPLERHLAVWSSDWARNDEVREWLRARLGRRS